MRATASIQHSVIFNLVETRFSLREQFESDSLVGSREKLITFSPDVWLLRITGDLVRAILSKTSHIPVYPRLDISWRKHRLFAPDNIDLDGNLQIALLRQDLSC